MKVLIDYPGCPPGAMYVVAYHDRDALNLAITEGEWIKAKKGAKGDQWILLNPTQILRIREWPG